MSCLDHFPVDPAIGAVRATGHQLVTLCRFICAEERAQILEPLTGSKYFTTYFITFVALFSHRIFLFTELDAVLQRLGRGAASDTSADESEASHPRRRVWSKRTYKVNKVCGKMKWVGFWSLEPQMRPANQTASTAKLRQDVSVLTHYPHEVLRHFQGVKHFARGQRLRLETPGWRVLDFEETPSVRVCWGANGNAFFVVL